MDDKFVCAKCGHDVFEDKGFIDFANIKFRGLVCEKCGNRMLLEEYEYDYAQITHNSDKICISFDRN